jgi:hypothetical protein
MDRDFKTIIPLEGKEFTTAQETWRAKIIRFPINSRDERLLQMTIRFDPQVSGSDERYLDLWFKNGSDVTLIAEFAGLSEAIQCWLQDSGGSDELMFESASKRLVNF